MNSQPSEFFVINDDDNEIIKAKTCDIQVDKYDVNVSVRISDEFDQISKQQSNTGSSSTSLQSVRTLPEELQPQNICQYLDHDILSSQAKISFNFTSKSPQDWHINFTKKCSEVEMFFKDCPFNSLIDTAFNTEDSRLIKTITLTLDYFTNLITLILYLIWKWIYNENQMDMINFVKCQEKINEFFTLIFQLRLNELRREQPLVEIIIDIVKPFPIQFSMEELQKPFFTLGISQNYKSFPNIQQYTILPWKQEEVAFIITYINQTFYADLQISNIIVKNGLKQYFKRINSVSQYIIYSVVKHPCKYQRQYALAYWIDLAEKLQQFNDLEGLFIVFKYGIQLLLKDYISTMPILFRDQNRIHKINIFYEQNIKDNFINVKNTQKQFYIPSFQKYQTIIRRLEQQAKLNRKIFEQIADILEKLSNISKEQFSLKQQINHQLTFQQQEIYRFLTQGIEQELQNNLQIPLEKETLVYIQLIKLSKVSNQ